MRQHSRVTFRPANRLRVLERDSGEPLGLIADLSVGGLCLLSDMSLAAGRCYAVSVEVPGREGRFRLVEIAMVCQWRCSRLWSSCAAIALRMRARP